MKRNKKRFPNFLLTMTLCDALQSIASKVKRLAIVWGIKVYVFFLFLSCRIIFSTNIQTEKLLSSSLPVFLIFWHGRTLLVPRIMAKKYKRLGSAVVSKHRDGEYLSSFICSYGHKAIRGSSNRGATTALRGVLHALKQNSLVAITPDGPTGPKFKINGSVFNTAKQTNTPIVCLTYSSTNPIVLNTWDSHVIPLPFSTIYIKLSPPLSLHNNLNKRGYKTIASSSDLELLMQQQTKEADRFTGLNPDV